MIERYQSREMAAIFSDKNKFALFIDIEAALLEKLGRRLGIAAGDIRALRGLRARVNPAAIARLEEKTRHDITAFLSWVWARLPRAKGVKQFLHLGLTSSDLVDTALAIQMREALRLILTEIQLNLSLLKALSLKYRHLPIMGRTHGIHAEITSLGLKFLSFYSEGRRQETRLLAAQDEISHGKLSGSVGNFASSSITPEEEEDILKKLGLRAEPVSTQIIPRDRHAVVLARMAVMAGWVERIALEIRHLQRSEVGEISEPFNEGSQQGSSSMPHKRNPVLCENLCGLARLMRSYSLTGLENTALWHERDISHSSTERVAIPDAFHAAHFMLKRLASVLGGLKVHEGRIKENRERLLDLSASQKYLNALITSGLDRREAYKLVQRSSFRALQNRTGLFEELKADPEFPKKCDLNRAKPADFLKASGAIFKRTIRP